MGPETAAAAPDEAAWFAAQRRWTSGWRRFVLPVVFLAYLIFVGQAVNKYHHDFGGYFVLGVFVAAYLALPLMAWPRGGSRRLATWWFWVPYALLFVAFVAELPFAHAAGFALCLYITAISVGRFGARAAPIVVVLAVSALVIPVAIPTWHVSLAGAFDDVTPLAIPVVALVTFAVLRVQRANLALAEARAEIAWLSAENERSRIARDLHDLLGHSLTTVTMKAALARRVIESDSGRAAREIAEVEDLSRRALAEVRGAVSNYREVTLAGELARGKELLRASGVAADFPTATDVVDLEHQELFGWVVREGITNVARHARATACTVNLSPAAVEISDDGVGGTLAGGHGLAGLKERVAAAGGMLEAGPLEPRGWRLRVAVESAPAAT